MPEIKLVNIQLNKQEAETFKWFRRHQDIIERARRELRPGRLILHFNSAGNIDKEEYHIVCQKT